MAVSTNRKYNYFVHENHMYTLNATSNRDEDLKFYICSVPGCKGRIHVKDGKWLKTVTVHNHLADVAKLEAQKVVNSVKRKAESSQEGTSKIGHEGHGQLVMVNWS